MMHIDKNHPIGMMVDMNDTTEQWRPLIDFPNYLISDMGRVSRNGKIVALFRVKGYLAFNALDGPRRKSLRVHREVARSFLGHHDGLHVRHLDGDLENCRLVNLAWGTIFDNEADKRRHGKNLAGMRHPMRKLTEEQVLEVLSSPDSANKLAIRFGVNRTTTSRIRLGRNWKHIPRNA
jgi:HNH endonuclease